MVAEIEQPLVLLATVVDHAQRALGETRARLFIDIADAGVLDPKRCPAATAIGEETIVQAVFDLGVRLGVRPAVIPSYRAPACSGSTKRAKARPLARIANAEHRGSILGPIDAVVGNVPAIGSLAYGLQHLFEIELE
jgi:hypothetical protein